MHYQFVLNPARFSELSTTLSGASTEFHRYKTEFLEYDEYIIYTVFQDRIEIIFEVGDGIRQEYFKGCKFDFTALPFLMGVVCGIHNKRILVIGNSVHTVSVFKADDEHSRFIPTMEKGKLVFHDREGVVFTKQDNFYIAVPEELVSNLFIKRMGHSIKIYPDEYLIRFKENDGFKYVPWTELNLVHGEYRNLEGDAKLKEIEAVVDHYTAGVGSIYWAS